MPLQPPLRISYYCGTSNACAQAWCLPLNTHSIAHIARSTALVGYVDKDTYSVCNSRFYNLQRQKKNQNMITMIRNRYQESQLHNIIIYMYTDTREILADLQYMPDRRRQCSRRMTFTTETDCSMNLPRLAIEEVNCYTQPLILI